MKRTLITFLLLATPSLATLGGGVLMARAGARHESSVAPLPPKYAASFTERKLAEGAFAR